MAFTPDKKMTYASTWSLDALYKGAEDPALASDAALLETLAHEYQQLTKTLQGPQQEPQKLLRQAVDLMEQIQLITRRIGAFCHLRKSVDASDKAVSRYQSLVHNVSSSLEACQAQFEKYAAAVPGLEQIIRQDDKLKDYEFYFHELKEHAAHRLSDEAEEVFAKMNVSGGMAWADLYGYVSSNLTCPYHGDVLTLAGIRALAKDRRQAVRKSAYEAEIASYSAVEGPVAFALNEIKNQATAEASLRGYDSPLDQTLEQSRLQKKTLEAMLDAIYDALPKFQEYLKRKAALLGDKNGMPWYDLLAPMGEEDPHRYTIEEAHDYLVRHFESFCPELSAMIDRAFRERWIDFYPHTGKRGGAFCSNLPFIGQSRVLTNFTGEFSDIVTLAHELGHAFHGQQIQSHRPLNTRYSMPVAETASNFNEVVIMNDAIRHAEGAKKLRLVESQIQDETQIIVDILSRYLFEDSVFHLSSSRFLYPDELCLLMTQAQKKAFGNALDPDFLHPYMWCCKVHYYSASRSYYNFPYAFGGLFSRGLYAKYREQGSSFVNTYKELLHATTVMSCEDVAAIAGIDLTRPAFWRESLSVMTDQIDLFLTETA